MNLSLCVSSSGRKYRSRLFATPRFYDDDDYYCCYCCCFSVVSNTHTGWLIKKLNAVESGQPLSSLINSKYKNLEPGPSFPTCLLPVVSGTQVV